MSLFYFNLRGGLEAYDDEEGFDFADLQAAYRCAQTTARKVIDEASAQGEFVDLGQRYEAFGVRPIKPAEELPCRRGLNRRYHRHGMAAGQSGRLVLRAICRLGEVRVAAERGDLDDELR
jgi:hypothetical protein